MYRLTNYVIVVDNPPNFLVNFVGNKHLMTGPEGNSSVLICNLRTNTERKPCVTNLCDAGFRQHPVSSFL